LIDKSGQRESLKIERNKKGLAVGGFHYNLGPFFSSKLVIVIFHEMDKLNPPLISHFNNFNAL